MAQHIEGFRDGSVAERLNLSTIRALAVAVPPLPEQRAIAHILGTLDDKMELNRQMNRTLEEIARALFKAWFVDFDPVRAKMEGREMGLPREIAELFPDELVESEMGEVPKGWRVATLSEVTNLITKGTTPTQHDIDTAPDGCDSTAQIAYVRVNTISDRGDILTDKLTSIPESVHSGALKRSILHTNDVLYTIAGTIGRICIVEGSLLPANTNQAVAIIRPTLAMPAGYVALAMQQPAFRESLHSNIVHAVQANLSLGVLSRARIVVPPNDNLLRIYTPIGEIEKRMSTTRAECRTLAALRDTLLPKLISGEIRVPDVEEYVVGVP